MSVPKIDQQRFQAIVAQISSTELREAIEDKVRKLFVMACVTLGTIRHCTGEGSSTIVADGFIKLMGIGKMYTDVINALGKETSITCHSYMYQMSIGHKSDGYYFIIGHVKDEQQTDNLVFDISNPEMLQLFYNYVKETHLKYEFTSTNPPPEGFMPYATTFADSLIKPTL